MAEPVRVIRTAELRDAVRIADIYNQSIRAGDSTMDTQEVGPSDVASWIQGQGSGEFLEVVSSERDSEPVGWGIVRRYHPRPGYAPAGETSVYIDRDETGKGHGSVLQQHLIELCRGAGYHHLVAKIWAANDGSIRMHQRFGYEVVGVQREIGLVNGQRQDVAILQLVLD